MTIAEKITRAKTDYDAVYEAGKAAGGGGDNHYDAFWDLYQQNGARTNYSYAFCGDVWTDELFDPKYDMRPTGTGAGQMFYQAKIPNLKQLLLDKGIELDLSQVTGAWNTFQYCSTTHLPFLNFASCTHLGATCSFMPNLKELSIFSREDTTWQNTVNNCPSLVDVNISGTIGKDVSFAQSPLLSTESVQSIIDALKDLTGATAQKVVFHSTVLAKITDEQFATITAKNWTL